MVVGSCVIKIRAEWVNSLKEKRMEVKKIVDKLRNRFNISVAEVGSNDNHRIIEIGFCTATNDAKVANSVIDNVINFTERITDGEIIDISVEIL